MIFELVFKVLYVKHVCAVLLSFFVAYLFLSHVHHDLVPVWVLHFRPPLDGEFVHQDAFKVAMSHVIIAYSDETPIGSLPTGVNIVICSQLDGEAALITYRLPSLIDLEQFLLNKKRKSTFLHQLLPVTHYHLPNHNVLTLVAEYIKGNLVYAIVSTPTQNNASVSGQTHLLSLVDASARVLWNQSLPLSFENQAVISLSIDPYCRMVTSTVCGTVFVTHPVFVNGHNDFSTLALSVEDGTVLWSYQPQESHTKHGPPTDGDFIEKYWKLALLDKHRSRDHVRVSSWQNYRKSFANVLPIQWNGPVDHRLVAIYASPDTLHSAISSVRNKPNAIVSVHPLGIDMLDLVSGKPLARLSYAWKRGATYAVIPSLNQSGYFFRSPGDSSLHEISLTSALISSRTRSSRTQIKDGPEQVAASDEEAVVDLGDFSHTVDCRGVMQRLDFDVDNHILSRGRFSVIHSGLCRPHSIFEFSRLGRPDWLEDEEKTVAPLVLKRHTPSTGLVSLWNSVFPSLALNLPFHNTASVHRDNPDGYDIVFLSSDGSLTSVSNLGHEIWRVNTEVSWLQISRAITSTHDSVDSHLRDFYRNRFQPSIWKADLRPLGVGTSSHGLLSHTRSTDRSASNDHFTLLSAIVSVGWDSVSVVDRYSGDLLATHRLPSHPIGKPILVPLLRSSDGSNRDEEQLISSLFVIPCEGMLVAFGIGTQVRWTTVFMTIGCLFTSFMLLSILCAPSFLEEYHT